MLRCDLIAAFDQLFVYCQDEFWVYSMYTCTAADASVTATGDGHHFSVTLQSEISQGSQGSRSSLHFLN